MSRVPQWLAPGLAAIEPVPGALYQIVLAADRDVSARELQELTPDGVNVIRVDSTRGIAGPDQDQNEWWEYALAITFTATGAALLIGSSLIWATAAVLLALAAAGVSYAVVRFVEEPERIGREIQQAAKWSAVPLVVLLLIVYLVKRE